MTMNKATMTSEWRAQLVEVISSVWETKGYQAVLNMLKLVGQVYGNEEEERIATEVVQGR